MSTPSVKVTSTRFDATLNPGSGKDPDRVQVSIGYGTEGGNSSFSIPITLPTGTITGDVQKAQVNAYRGAASILGALERSLRKEIVKQ